MHTPQVLDRLRAEDVPATFFLVGSRARRHPAIVAEILAAGHAVGSHSWSHPEPGALGATALVEDFRKGRETVEDLAGRAVPAFRPPQGHIDLRVAVAVRRLGLHSWLWSDDPHDWEPGCRTQQILDRVADVQGGAVVLLHDGLASPLEPRARDRSATVEAVQPLCALIRRRGLGFAALPER